MAVAGEDTTRRSELAHFFASPELLIEARSGQLQERPRDEPAGLGLEEQVELLRRPAEGDSTILPDLASSLSRLSDQLRALGRREEAMPPIAQAVGLYRGLAETNPDRFMPEVAHSLNNRSNGLGDVGRRDEGLAAIEEAVTVYRRLATANPAAYEPDLAMSLNNLRVRMAEVGRRDEALAAIEEAVAIRRRLAAAYPAA